MASGTNVPKVSEATFVSAFLVESVRVIAGATSFPTHGLLAMQSYSQVVGDHPSDRARYRVGNVSGVSSCRLSRCRQRVCLALSDDDGYVVPVLGAWRHRLHGPRARPDKAGRGTGTFRSSVLSFGMGEPDTVKIARVIDPATIQVGQRARYQCPYGNCTFSFLHVWTADDVTRQRASHCFLHAKNPVMVIVEVLPRLGAVE